MRWIVLLLLFSCKTSKPLPTAIITKCDQQAAMDIADRLIRKGGYELETLKRDVVEFKPIFFIRYTPIESRVRGNAADVSISRDSCKVIEAKFYQ
jgi:hypothetical protein